MMSELCSWIDENDRYLKHFLHLFITSMYVGSIIKEGDTSFEGHPKKFSEKCQETALASLVWQ